MRTTLEQLKEKSYRLGLVSNGPLASQTAKVNALGLAGFYDPMVLTGAWDPEYSKPHPRAFALIEKTWELSGPQVAYVADNPLKDFVAPRGRGWRTIRVRTPGQLNFGYEAPVADFAPDDVCDSVEGACERLLA